MFYWKISFRIYYLRVIYIYLYKFYYYKEGSLLRIQRENSPQGKQRPLGRPRLRWEDRIQEDVKKVKPEMDWKKLSLDKEIWRRICWTTWF